MQRVGSRGLRPLFVVGGVVVVVVVNRHKKQDEKKRTLMSWKLPMKSNVSEFHTASVEVLRGMTECVHAYDPGSSPLKAFLILSF